MRVAFLGAGNMAAAMVAGLLRGGADAASLSCAGGPGGTAQRLATATGITLLGGPGGVPADTDVVVLAVKPQTLPKLDPAWGAACEGRLVLSVLAGTTLARLRAFAPGARAVARAMPNTPGRIGVGITGWCADALGADDEARVARILAGLGEAVRVGEGDMDAVTALGGSGPAYLFEFVAALREAGAAAGLPPELARRFADATVAGAARLLAESGADPEELRRQVTSPGGTTAAGLAVLEAAGFRGTIRQTVLAARDRARQLAST